MLHDNNHGIRVIRLGYAKPIECKLPWVILGRLGA